MTRIVDGPLRTAIREIPKIDGPAEGLRLDALVSGRAAPSESRAARMPASSQSPSRSSAGFPRPSSARRPAPAAEGGGSRLLPRCGSASGGRLSATRHQFHFACGKPLHSDDVPIELVLRVPDQCRVTTRARAAPGRRGWRRTSPQAGHKSWPDCQGADPSCRMSASSPAPSHGSAIRFQGAGLQPA